MMRRPPRSPLFPYAPLFRSVLPGGASLPLVPDTLPAEPAWSVRAFVADTAAYRLPPAPGRYLGWLPAGAMCADGRTACATLVVAAGGDTATARWPLTITDRKSVV